MLSQADVPGATQNGKPGSCEQRDPFVERVLGVVAPLAHGDAIGHLRDERRIAGEHVAPDDHLVAVELGERAQRRDPGEVLVEALARQLPRLVEADVHAPAREQRQQLAEQLADERERSRVAPGSSVIASWPSPYGSTKPSGASASSR